MTTIDAAPTLDQPTHASPCGRAEAPANDDASSSESFTAPAADGLDPQTPVLSAEEQLHQATVELRDVERELTAARQTIDALERREKIGDRLRQAGAIDLEVARLLTEVAIADMDEPDIRLAVDDLRRHKPYLFAESPAPLGRRSMGARVESSEPADAAAARAGESGDRRDLMDYLRLRRRP